MVGHIQGCFEYEVVLVNRRGLRDSQALVAFWTNSLGDYRCHVKCWPDCRTFLALRWRHGEIAFRRHADITLRSADFFVQPACIGIEAYSRFFIADVAFGLFGVSWAHSLDTHIP